MKKIKEYVMPDDLLESVAEYTLKLAKNDGTLYSTTEVKDYVDKKMGMEQFPEIGQKIFDHRRISYHVYSIF